jgi:histidine triad (HIT) family protein
MVSAVLMSTVPSLRGKIIAMKETNCVFCGILAGTLESSMVYRDAACAAFLTIQPINPGHLLVVPNRHAASLAELEPQTGARMFQAAQLLAAALRGSGLRCEGINLFLADGAAAMQEVFHVHLHVLPRFKDDNFGLRFPPNYEQSPARSALEAAAAAIRKVLTHT